MAAGTRSHTGWGLWLALASAATFGSSGPFAKSLLVEGWSSGAIVLLRVAGATLVLAAPTTLALRGRWSLVRTNLWSILAYGAVAVAGCQVAYFYAVQRLDVGVALLLEYLGVVLVVLWVWLRTRRAPGALTGLGVVLAVLGLVLVLDLSGQSRPDLVGVAWGLVAATGLATFFVLAAEDSSLPPVALAGLGMGAGSVVLGALGAVGVIPLTFVDTRVELMGRGAPWWVAIGELALIAAAAAYLLGVTAARMLGSTVASFVGLTEVLFAVLFAWLLLDELPGLMQLAGGVCIVGGVVAVRLGELRRARAERGRAAAEETDFPLPAGVA
ncbi:Threonine/homoserine efflux transporter RhtA [Pedococcus dokdonensis]|uniref:Threonine/homoserine efflux transporter RhtA n=1 Tax=Pedococcus dokdonensis TaxID=443156 RepID=A0A1H0S8V6_9MICO|nr:DMT family transporter [Pedococcus dokdonensis]SDP38241.1 Threonine/homoserine efflux transporter RhtA [Pedococcus dokdonensis]